VETASREFESCSDDSDPCPLNVAQSISLEWLLGGEDPEEIVIKSTGTTVEGFDQGIHWWNPDFSLARTDEMHFQPGEFFPTGGGPLQHTGARDIEDVVATDYGFTIDCDNLPEETLRTCDAAENFESFVWKDEGTYQITVTLRKTIDGEMTDICDATVTVDVDRNTDDPLLQPLDFFLQGPLLPEAHTLWHEARDDPANHPIFPGDDWLLFHRVLVRSYDEFREFFGYPRIEPWDGSSPIPITENGYTMADPTRSASPPLHCSYPEAYPDTLTTCEPPPWLTVAGDGTPRPEDLPENTECHTAAGEPVPIGQTKLADFGDANSLGCVVNRTHHGFVHAAVPGAMTWIVESPFDPIFWNFHKWASGDGSELTGLAAGSASGDGTALASRGASDDESWDAGDGSPEARDAAVDGTAYSASTDGAAFLTPTPRGAIESQPPMWTSWENEKAKGAPGISAVFPPRYATLADVDGVLVLFYEDVSGVDAGDLTVNGSPATDVDQDGRSFLFTGFEQPLPPPDPVPAMRHVDHFNPVEIDVELASGGIVDADSNAFPGASWTLYLAPDFDGDGVPDDRDNCPEIANLDQKNSDFELTHGYHLEHMHGEEPTIGYLGDHLGDACDADADDDGLSNTQENALGSDPLDPRDPDACPFDPLKTEPLECGCGVSERDRDEDGEPECIPPLFDTTTTTVEAPTTTLDTTTTTLPAPQCARPLTTGDRPKASDCLFILRTAVGSQVCEPLCICAPTGTLPVKATDSLLCLRVAVGGPNPLNCPCN